MVSALRRLVHLAEHLGRGRLVEADRRVDHADGVEQAGHTEPGRIAGHHRLGETLVDEALRGEVVDLGRAMLLDHVDQRRLIGQVGADQRDALEEVPDALEVRRARAPHHADDLVALVEQKLGEIRTVLAGDPSDECAGRHHRSLAEASRTSPFGRPFLAERGDALLRVVGQRGDGEQRVQQRQRIGRRLPHTS